MRFWAIKIIFLLAAGTCYSSAPHAKEYDFFFDVRNQELSQKLSTTISSPNTSTASWRAGMHATFSPDFIKGSGELVYGGFSGGSKLGDSGWDKYLMKIGLSGERDTFKFGVNFYSVGQNFEGNFNSEYRDKKGFNGYESWLTWSFNKLQVKSKYSKYWTKKPSNINHNSTSEQWYEIESSYPLSSAPFTEFSIAYRIGEKSHTNISDNINTYEGPLTSLKARFNFSDNYFKSSLELIQSSSQNKLNDRKGIQKKMIYINSILFPESPLSITSSYRASLNTQASTTYKRKLNKQESSLGLIYKLPELPGNLKITSGYNNSRSDDGLIDLEYVNFGAQFDLSARKHNTGLNTSWTMNFRYKHILDNTNPNLSASNWSFSLLCSLPLS